jgi:cobaltochelatase CobS
MITRRQQSENDAVTRVLNSNTFMTMEEIATAMGEPGETYFNACKRLVADEKIVASRKGKKKAWRMLRENEKPDTSKTDGDNDTSEDEANELRELLAEAKKENANLQQMLENRRGPVQIVVRDKETKTKRTIESCHATLPALIQRVDAGVHTYLVGPAGSGKTTAGEQAARALKLKFGFMSVGPQTTKSDIVGFISAGGKYIPTEFRRRYQFGGLFLFDEMDAANAGVLTSVNAALAGDTASFPDAMVPRHKEFRCIAAGNTFGTGPDRQYVGRQELDAASLDRFNFLEWGYDEGLELSIAQNIDKEIANDWVPFIQKVRKAVNELSIRHVVSPRASINGTKLLKINVPLAEVKQTQVWKSLKPDVIARITATMENYATSANA